MLRGNRAGDRYWPVVGRQPACHFSANHPSGHPVPTSRPGAQGQRGPDLGTCGWNAGTSGDSCDHCCHLFTVQVSTMCCFEYLQVIAVEGSTAKGRHQHSPLTTPETGCFL